MELVVLTDLKSVAFGRGGSTPPTRTKLYFEIPDKVVYSRVAQW